MRHMTQMMISVKPQSASSIPVDQRRRQRQSQRQRQRQRQQSNESGTQDESFQAFVHGYPVSPELSPLDMDVDTDQDASANNLHPPRTSQTRRLPYEPMTEVPQDIDASASYVPEHVHASRTPSTRDSIPWLDTVHSLSSASSAGLPFGLHFANTSSSSEYSDYDEAMADYAVSTIRAEPPMHMTGLETTSPPQTPHPGHHQTPLLQSEDLADDVSEDALSFTSSAAPYTGSQAGQSSLPFGWISETAHSDSNVASPYPAPFDGISTDGAQAPSPDPTDGELPPVMPSTVNAMIFGSENVGVHDFLRYWAHSNLADLSQGPLPESRSIHQQADYHIAEVKYSDLRGDHCDMQGLNFAHMGTTRKAARTRRHITYRNYTNHQASDQWTPCRPDVWIPSPENYFRFRKMTIGTIVPNLRLAHFQLRSVLACPSRSQIFYPGVHGISRFNPISRKANMAVKFNDHQGSRRVVTTLDANRDVLVAGMFSGDYILKPLHSEDDKYLEGAISDLGGLSSISNHLQVHSSRRSSTPLAAFANNNTSFRIMDIERQQFVDSFKYDYPLNCTAISPDRRLRVMVGDSKNVVIANAETGEIESQLSGHRDYGFACAWSDDGRTIATGCQDKCIKIWDTRKQKDSKGIGTPVTSIWCEQAGVRNLQFSPLGSGHPVLVAAEEADFINIIDANRFHEEDKHAFQRKQTIDFFGEVGGIGFTNDGQELNVLVCDPLRGGLLQLERCRTKSGWRLGPHLDQVPVF